GGPDGVVPVLAGVADAPPGIQVKLFRVRQEPEFRRIGGTHTIKVDVRILAATNKDLDKAAAQGLFREGLYYRLNVIPITLPPLWSHPADIHTLDPPFLTVLRRPPNHPARTACT